MAAMGLQVELPMIFQFHNKGNINLSKNWIESDRTWHMNVQMYMIHNLNKQKLIYMELVNENETSTDLGTKS